MLAQNFKSADELKISEAQKDALIKTLVLLETGKLIHASPDDEDFFINNSWEEAGLKPRFDGRFNLGTWAATANCGTVACIGGTAEAISGVRFHGWMDRLDGLRDLFTPQCLSFREWSKVTPTEAATALRSYLTTGDARWDLAVASSV
ncbi:hypothetical protein JQ633_00915 [Bradyrhizobium tropiciagri]|uniref:hypothetical protein n=1 Tax=Bradyrhizobium tropiciagri TaxID=312253 RepID=UPI001BAD99B7|nr:hypothetical protein [Bradyrhizobium tropiciagri]MBR0868901.1 hypothetical protein [Bradyrhizobium tropiciagri]